MDVVWTLCDPVPARVSGLRLTISQPARLAYQLSETPASTTDEYWPRVEILHSSSLQNCDLVCRVVTSWISATTAVSRRTSEARIKTGCELNAGIERSDTLEMEHALAMGNSRKRRRNGTDRRNSSFAVEGLMFPSRSLFVG